VKLTTQPHLVRTLRIFGVLPPRPHVASWRGHGEIYLYFAFRHTRASLRIFYLYASHAVYILMVNVCSRAIHEHHHFGPDADVFCLSQIIAGQFNFASFLFPHEVHKIRSDAIWDVSLYVSSVKLVNGPR